MWLSREPDLGMSHGCFGNQSFRGDVNKSVKTNVRWL